MSLLSNFAQKREVEKYFNTQNSTHPTTLRLSDLGLIPRERRLYFFHRFFDHSSQDNSKSYEQILKFPGYVGHGTRKARWYPNPELDPGLSVRISSHCVTVNYVRTALAEVYAPGVLQLIIRMITHTEYFPPLSLDNNVCAGLSPCIL